MRSEGSSDCSWTDAIYLSAIFSRVCPPADAVGVSDLQRVGRDLMQSNPSMCVIGDLQDVPSRREMETALFENGGVLNRQKKGFFSF